MKLLSLFVAAAVSTVAIADTFRLGYDTIYDDPSQSLNIVACSTGTHGLVDRFPTFGDLPTFPNIGAFAAVEGYNSVNCGTCWSLSSDFVSAPLYAIAIDAALQGSIILSVTAVDTLSNRQAIPIGTLSVNATQVDGSYCDLD